MKVLHVIPAVAPRYGGPSSSIVQICRALGDAGAEVLIATTNADGERDLDMPLGVPVDWQGVRAVFFQRQWSEAFKYSRPLSTWLEQHVKEYDVVHAHAPLSHSSHAASRAAFRRDVPYIVRPLGTLDQWSLQQKAMKKRLLLPFVGRMLRRAAAVHCTSAEEMHQVETALHISNGVVIPLGVDLSAMSALFRTDGQRAGDRYVLALSRLHPVKNLEALVEGFADLIASGAAREWRLVIAGDGDEAYATALDTLIARRNTAGRVSRIGWVEGDAKADLVRGASIFALPSHHENFGVGLVEAMAAGVPALVSRGVHLATAIDRARAGWIVEGSSASIRSGLAAAIADEMQREARGENARRLSETFAWPSIARQLLTLYDTAVVRLRELPAHQRAAVRPAGVDARP